VRVCNRSTSLKVRFTILIIGILFAFPALAEKKEQWVADNDSICGGGTSTADIVSCQEKRSDFWDRRLNQAYRAVMETFPAQAADRAQAQKQQVQLRSAQRLWIQYRDANCGLYAMGDGSIRRVLAADCYRRMTQDRAIELHDWGLE
jgi:uncharacterized protein YecT (DUF1311 family)